MGAGSTARAARARAALICVFALLATCLMTTSLYAAWVPLPTPTRIPTQPPQATSTPGNPIPTPTRIPLATATAAAGTPLPLPMPGTIWITLEIQADGQPKGIPIVYEIRTTDTTRPLCQFLFEAGCVVRIERR